MTEDITSLQIRILYDSVTEAERRLRELERTGGRVGPGMRRQEGATNSLIKRIGVLAASYITLRGVISGFQAVIRTTAEFQQLNAQLVTATGSAEKAAIAFAAIKDFAATTPYDLQQATGAFISLVNRGLEPSERALRAYGDTASSMGFQLSEMVLAVSNATAGEFENLKRFGIRAAKEGDNVKFTFRGVTTEVKNNIEAIEGYFIELGEKSFAGGMERQMQTLTGAFSNFGDAWEVMLNRIGEGGLGDLVENTVRQATAAIEDFTAAMESGRVEAALDAWAIGFEGFSEGWVQILDSLTNESREAYDGFYSDSTSVWEDVIAYLQGIPPSFTALVETIAITLWGIVEAIAEVGRAAYEQFKADLDALIGLAKAAGAAIAAALSGNFSGAWQGLKDDFNTTMQDNVKRSARLQTEYQNNMVANANNTAEGIAEAWQRAGDRLDRQQSKRQEGRQRQADYDAKAGERAKEREDRLAQFAIKAPGGSGGDSTSGGSKGKKGGGGADKEAREWETLEQTLRDQETLISESYQRRFDLIEKNTREGSAYQAELEISLTEKFQEEQQRRIDKMKEQPETMFQAYEEENRIIEEAYARRKDIILNATELTEEEKLKMLKEAELQYTASMRKHEIERNKLQLGIAADFFGNLAAIAGAFGKRGSKIAKAAAIAQTTIKTYESATSAYAALAGIPYVGPVLGAAAAGAAIAAGMANVAAIRAQDDSGGYAGAYATGGVIPAGKFGLVGEAGPEFVQGPAMVTSAASTADRLANPAGAGAKPIVVNIANYSGAEVQASQRETPDAMIVEIVARQVEAKINRGLHEGSSPLAGTLEKAYNLRRGA